MTKKYILMLEVTASVQQTQLLNQIKKNPEFYFYIIQ